MHAFPLAREDLQAGRPWMARDRLLGTMGTRRGDAEALLLLGEVYAAMNDLPAAGAAWFLTAKPETGEALAAAAAFSTRYPNPAARAERLPMHRPLSEYPAEAVGRVKALKNELEAEGWSWHPPAKPQAAGRRALRRHRDFQELTEEHTGGPTPTWRSRLRDIAFGAFMVYMVVGFFAVWVIGFITAVRWIWG